MAKNKIENLRRYSELGRIGNDTTGELDEDSNDFSRGDPLWYKRIEKGKHKTLLRPSLNVSYTKESSTVLDSDSETGNFNPLEKDWYVRLTKYEKHSLNSPTKRKSIRQSASGVPKSTDSKSSKKVHSSSESDSNVMDSLRKKKKLDKSKSPASRNSRQNRNVVLTESDDSDSEEFLRPRKKSLHLRMLKKDDSHGADAFFKALEDEPSTLENPNSSTNRKSASKLSFLSNKDSFNKSKNVESTTDDKSSEQSYSEMELKTRKRRNFMNLRKIGRNSTEDAFKDFFDEESSSSEPSAHVDNAEQQSSHSLSRTKSNLQNLSKTNSNLQDLNKTKLNLQDLSKTKSNLQDLSKTKSNLQNLSTTKADIQNLSEIKSNRQSIQESVHEEAQNASVTGQRTLTKNSINESLNSSLNHKRKSRDADESHSSLSDQNVKSKTIESNLILSSDLGRKSKDANLSHNSSHGQKRKSTVESSQPSSHSKKHHTSLERSDTSSHSQSIKLNYVEDSNTFPQSQRENQPEEGYIPTEELRRSKPNQSFASNLNSSSSISKNKMSTIEEKNTSTSESTNVRLAMHKDDRKNTSENFPGVEEQKRTQEKQNETMLPYEEAKRHEDNEEESRSHRNVSETDKKHNSSRNTLSLNKSINETNNQFLPDRLSTFNELPKFESTRKIDLRENRKSPRKIRDSLSDMQLENSQQRRSKTIIQGKEKTIQGKEKTIIQGKEKTIIQVKQKTIIQGKEETIIQGKEKTKMSSIYNNSKNFDEEEESSSDVEVPAANISGKRNKSNTRHLGEKSRESRYLEAKSKESHYLEAKSKESRYLENENASRYLENGSRDSRYLEDGSRESRYLEDGSRESRYLENRSRESRYLEDGSSESNNLEEKSTESEIKSTRKDDVNERSERNPINQSSQSDDQQSEISLSEGDSRENKTSSEQSSNELLQTSNQRFSPRNKLSQKNYSLQADKANPIPSGKPTITNYEVVKLRDSEVKRLITGKNMESESFKSPSSDSLSSKSDVTSPRRDVASPESDDKRRDVASPKSDVKSKNDVKSKGDVKSKSDVTFSKRDATFSKNDVTFSKSDVKSKSDVTFSKRDATFSKNDVIFSKNDVTFSKNDVTTSKKNVTSPKRNVTSSKRDVKSPKIDVKLNKTEGLKSPKSAKASTSKNEASTKSIAKKQISTVEEEVSRIHGMGDEKGPSTSNDRTHVDDNIFSYKSKSSNHNDSLQKLQKALESDSSGYSESPLMSYVYHKSHENSSNHESVFMEKTPSPKKDKGAKSKSTLIEDTKNKSLHKFDPNQKEASKLKTKNVDSNQKEASKLKTKSVDPNEKEASKLKTKSVNPNQKEASKTKSVNTTPKEGTKKLSRSKSPYKIKVFSQDEIKACNDALAKRLQKSEMMEKEILKSEAQRKANLQKKAKPTKIRKPRKAINKAYIVNGAPYKQPKLPRPAYWATDSLYKFIFKKLEPKYGLRHRILAEKIVRDLGELSKKALKAKKYAVYQQDLDDVMKKMAKLGIIGTRFDWNSFCIDFLPYDLREKFTPMMLPGNKMNIPYNPDDLDKPLI